MADRRGPPSEFQDRAAEIADHTGVFFDNWHDRSSNVSRNARARLPRGDRSKPIGEILTTNRSQSPVEGVSTERSQFDTVFTVLRPTKQSHRSGRCDFVRLRVKNGPLRGVRASAPDRANPISGGSCDQTKPIRGGVLVRFHRTWAPFRILPGAREPTSRNRSGLQLGKLPVEKFRSPCVLRNGGLRSLTSRKPRARGSSALGLGARLNIVW
jgi:hypothetical protein